MKTLGRLTEARRLLKRHFGYGGFRSAQLRVIGPILAGRDTLAVLPTGGGKSICFQVPALMSTGLTLVISPLISLMQDQVGTLRERGIPAGMLNRSVSPEEERATVERLRAGDLRLLYTAPERIISLLPLLPPVSLLAVDEAHCISEWGLSFRPAYRRLGQLRARLGRPQTIALTGSATPVVRRDIVNSLAMRGAEEVVGSFDRPNLSFEAYRVRDNAHRFRAIVTFIKQRDVVTLLYAPTRNLVEDLTRHLIVHGVRAAPYHAGLDQDVRRNVLASFLANELQVVVATSAFGMGIDKPDVRLVLHWGPPPTLESYYQEAGRAGRDGLAAHCVLLHSRKDMQIRHEQLRSTPKERRPVERTRLEAMGRYLGTRTCRRAAMLAYFGELMSACTGCDRCGRFVRETPTVSAPAPVPDLDLVHGLLQWRRRVAKRDDVPETAYLTDLVILRLAGTRPDTEETLADVDGVGPELVARHGRALLGILKQKEGTSAPPEPDHPELFEALRAWRNDVAKEAALPPYCVLSNRALVGVANALPATRDALAGVPGFGPKTLEKYGAQVLALVGDYQAGRAISAAEESARREVGVGSPR